MSERHLADFYTNHYTNRKSHDSPERSRVNMARRVVEAARKSGGRTILDVGAGRGDVERLILQHPDTDRLALVSLDIAAIPYNKLIRPGRRTHVQADSRVMPFASGLFDIVCSNLSIDMLRRNQNGDYERALAEMRRVSRLGARALFSFHHADLFTDLSREYRGDDDITAEYFNGVADDNPFYAQPEEVLDDLSEAGFVNISVQLAEGRNDRWWEVQAIAG